MGSQMETVKDSEGNSHVIFDESSIYDDSQMGNKLSDFEILQVLNESQNSLYVAKVRSLNNHKIYAMKRIEFNKIPNGNNFLNTMNNLIQLNNSHIVKYYKYFVENNKLYLFMEFMNNSDINGFIKAHQILDKNIKEEEIWNILLQCLSALEYLHKQNLGQYGIKLCNIFMNNEQNAKIGVFSNPSQTINNYNEDINLLGKYFYVMCFSQLPQLKEDEKPIKFSQIDCSLRVNNQYSPELMNIIYCMIDQKYNTTTIYNEVKNQYVKRYARNSSIEAVLSCLYSYPLLNKYIFDHAQYIEQNRDNKYINYWYLQAVKALSGLKAQDLKECMEEFRRAIASENSKLDGSKEIDPLYLLAFLLEKMHKELNKVEGNSSVQNQIGKYVINSVFNGEEEDKTNREQMLHKFVTYFNANINSVISDYFFGFVKTKRICNTCKTGNYSFHNFCFVVFDLSDNQEQKFELINDGFEYQYNYCKELAPDKPERVYCERCLTYQLHNEFNRYYSMSCHLIISFIRGNNFQNNTNVIFEENIDLTEFIDEKNASPCKFLLVGAINRYSNNGNEEFIYWARDPTQRNVWHLNNGITQQLNNPVNEIMSRGQVILLFYNSDKSMN